MRCRWRAVLPLAMNVRFDIDQFGLALFRFCDPSQPPFAAEQRGRVPRVAKRTSLLASAEQSGAADMRKRNGP